MGRDYRCSALALEGAAAHTCRVNQRRRTQPLRIINILRNPPEKLSIRRGLCRATALFTVHCQIILTNFVASRQLVLTVATVSSLTIEGNTMINKNQVQGTLKDAAGKIQKEAGKLMNNPKQEAQGMQKQSEGKAQKAMGDATEVVRDAKDALKDSIKNKG